jgi:undecaprenyl diphosphate synthase
MTSGKVPRHIAIIMDGNGRWARARGLSRTRGHLRGMETLEKTVHACIDRGVRYLTVYAFSTENWTRPKAEVRYLMGLIFKYLGSKLETFIKVGVRMTVHGSLETVDPAVRRELLRAVKRTGKNDRFVLNFAFNYGGRDEIVRAVRKLARTAGAALMKRITEKEFAGYLDHPEIPDPDLLIRTGAEVRLSNFLLWESSYSELYFSKVMWPDFSARELDKALAEYRRRQRRFGAVSPG